MVIITKHVQSNDREGISTKLVLKAQGPYRVLGKQTTAEALNASNEFRSAGDLGVWESSPRRTWREWS